MNQLTQNLKDGKMELLEVPEPALGSNKVLVRTHYSVISAGTEGKTVKDARLGYIGKAKSRQKEVKQVIDSVKIQGVIKTYNTVMNKLEAPVPLGYSSAGEIIAVGSDIKSVSAGDKVACGGSGANHSEVIAVSKNLFVKIPGNVELRFAAFTIVGSIAMQGIRQSELTIGENCVVIGLGIIGQLTMQILNAGGINAIGIDIDEQQVELAEKAGAGKAFNRNRDDIETVINNLTSGYGADAVIITAGTSSLDPVEFGGRICRKKGKVIIVGAVPTGFSREHYYDKELELKMSCSYGAGRYDSNYEEKGIDYPVGYVRWTERRNMEAFMDLLSRNKLNLEPLITHSFKFENAAKAYDLIINKTESFTGIILEYDVSKKLNHEPVYLKGWELTPRHLQSASPAIGFIGAGSFAQNMLLPNIENHKMVGVATARSNTSVYISKKYNFIYATCNADDIINDKNINTVFIVTRHNLHAKYVLKALQQGKNVFVEKPLCMNEDELEQIKSAVIRQKSVNKLMVGYNRRFSPHIKRLKDLLPDYQPKAINYRINAGTVKSEHWTQDIETGGGRIIGEVCHFIDLASFIAGSEITSVSANVMEAPENLQDTCIIILRFVNGSVASVSYFSNGNKSLPKESIEVFYAGQVFVINDFKEMITYSSKKSVDKLSKQDKGHASELKEFLESIKEGKSPPISFDEIYNSSLATFKVIESIKTGKTINLK